MSITDARYDLEGLTPLHDLRLGPMSWGGPVAGGGQVSTNDVLVSGTLEVTDEHGHRQRSVQVAFTRRVREGPRAALLGADASGSLRVSLRIDPREHVGRFTFQFTPTAEATPLDLNALVSWLGAIRQGRFLGLRGANGHWLVAPARLSEAAPAFPSPYGTAVAILARIQQRVGVSFLMPTEITEDLARAIMLTDRLLRGETVKGHWTEARVAAEDPELQTALREADHGVMVEFLAEHRLNIGGSDLVVGTVEYRYLSAIASDLNLSTSDLRLVPGDNDTLDVRLIAVPERTSPDGTTSWIPAPMVEQYAGNWVAQSGTSIVSSGNSLRSVANAVRASGQLATVWRVPRPGESSTVLPGEL